MLRQKGQLFFGNIELKRLRFFTENGQACLDIRRLQFCG